MPSEIPDELTMLLNGAAKGDSDAADRVWCTVYSDLRQAASLALGTPKIGERRAVGPTTVIEKAFLKIHRESATEGKEAWENRRTFFVAIARELARFLIEHRRVNPANGRGGFARVLPLGLDFDAISSFDAGLMATDAGVFDAIALLEKENPNAAEILWLRYVCGLTIDQTAELVKIEPRTVCKRWNLAKAWIRREIQTRLGRALPEAG